MTRNDEDGDLQGTVPNDELNSDALRRRSPSGNENSIMARVADQLDEKDRLITELTADFEASKAREQILRDWREDVKLIAILVDSPKLTEIVTRPLFIDEGAAS